MPRVKSYLKLRKARSEPESAVHHVPTTYPRLPGTTQKMETNGTKGKGAPEHEPAKNKVEGGSIEIEQQLAEVILEQPKAKVITFSWPDSEAWMFDRTWQHQKHVYIGGEEALQPALHYALLAGRFVSTKHATVESNGSGCNAIQLHTHIHPTKPEMWAQSTAWFLNGHEDYNRLRPLAYPQTDVMMLCYNRRDITTLQRVRDYWLEECKQGGNEETPVLLLGLDDEKLSERELAAPGYYDPLSSGENIVVLAPGERELLETMLKKQLGLKRKTGRRSGRCVDFMAVNLWDQKSVQLIPKQAYFSSQSHAKLQPRVGMGRRCTIS